MRNFSNKFENQSEEEEEEDPVRLEKEGVLTLNFHPRVSRGSTRAFL